MDKIPRSLVIDKDNKLTLVGAFLIIAYVEGMFAHGYIPVPKYLIDIIDMDK